MNLRENLRLAFLSLAANKLRAALTMLGILIGVAAVITLLSIGDGVTRYVADQFVGLGTNLVFILPVSEEQEFGPPGSSGSSLTIRDAERLKDNALLPNVAAMAPLVLRNDELQYQGNVYRTNVAASTPEYGEVRNYRAARGRFITDTDYNARSRVVVLGQDVVDGLFPEDVDALDNEVKIRGLTFRVVGILEAKGGGAFGSADDIAIVPLTTAQERLYNLRSPRNGELQVNMILLQTIDNGAVQDVVIDAATAMRQLHDITFRDEDDFLILTQEDFLDSFSEVTGVLTLFLGAIASISLLVGGIGIMNIMLVSVTERTREIGLRKAVGAKRRDILGQFLTEAIILAMLGGALGIVLGVVGATAVRLAVPELDTSVTWDSISLAVGFSVAVGLFFGIYPASRAARLNPIEALRFE
ncbi:MAG: ABC transporter permease [Chloroflexota bacterium]|nr:ABC transporter permease [Ardenticatenaceae bacterium]